MHLYLQVEQKYPLIAPVYLQISIRPFTSDEMLKETNLQRKIDLLQCLIFGFNGLDTM
jgi:hypothetical protein